MKLADDAFTQILDQNYGGKYKNPILISIVINDNLRTINAFKTNVKIPQKPETHMKEDNEANQSEDERTGPRPS
jgi:hypothetical protein